MYTQLRGLLRKYGIRLHRLAGQHIVIDNDVLKRMIEYADLTAEDVVLEVGAGTGNLTHLLAQRAGKVIAVERDRRLIRVLKGQLGEFSNVQLIQGDVLRLKLPKFDKVVSNLPYGISSDLTFKLLKRPFKLAVLMYQREFAHRMTASPRSHEYGRLTVTVFYRAGVELLEDVSPSAFYPPPKVGSAVVRLKPRKPPFKVLDEKLFFNLVRALFQHRRQRVRNALYHSFAEVFPDLTLRESEKRSFVDQKLPPEFALARVMDLPPEKFGTISDYLLNP
jgi:16S rRNA (adenine1518-N6/adenine1519-N6)-dimethyltransferase